MDIFSHLFPCLIFSLFCLALPSRGQGAGGGDDGVREVEESLSSIYEKAMRYFDMARDRVREFDYERTLKEVKDLYEKAKEAGEEVPADLYEWIREDIGRINTWEYTILAVDPNTRGDLKEGLEKLGKDRWECFDSFNSGTEIVLIFKRPARSYLRHLPLKDLLRVLPDGGEGE